RRDLSSTRGGSAPPAWGPPCPWMHRTRAGGGRRGASRAEPHPEGKGRGAGARGGPISRTRHRRQRHQNTPGRRLQAKMKGTWKAVRGHLGKRTVGLAAGEGGSTFKGGCGELVLPKDEEARARRGARSCST